MRISYGFVLQYYFSKVKQGRVVPVHVRRGSEVYLHFFLTLAVDRGEWSASCSGCLTPKQEPLYPLNSRLGESKSSGKKENLLPLLGVNPRLSSLVTKLTELS